MKVGYIVGWTIYLTGAVVILQTTANYWAAFAGIGLVLVGEKITADFKQGKRR